MVLSAGDKVLYFIFCSSLYLHTFMYFGTCTQDQTSSRPNTLSDDADDIQNQLDNEAADRIKFGRPKTVWVLHFPTSRPPKDDMVLEYARIPDEWEATTFPLSKRRVKEKTGRIKPAIEEKVSNGSEHDIPPKPCKPTKLLNLEEKLVAWDYWGQNKWVHSYPECGGSKQSPVDLPKSGLKLARPWEKVEFCNYQVVPNSMSLKSDGQRIILSGSWKHKEHPLLVSNIFGCRRYWFHSLVLHWPSEHTVSGARYPVESQLLFVSADYTDYDKALLASKNDPQAMLGLASLYKYGNRTEPGLKSIIKAATCSRRCNDSCLVKPLAHFVPALSEYAIYQGSLSTPPCTESVLWLVRGRALPVTKEDVARTNCILSASGQPLRGRSRSPQPLNKRIVKYQGLNV